MPNPTFLMRDATAHDLPQIIELLQLKAEFDGCANELLATPEKLEKDLFGDRPLASVLLVEVDEEMVGFATYHSIYSTFLAKPGIWLDDLYLKPNFRRQGIGRAIMQRLCQVADATDCGRIDWLVSTQNSNGIQFYQSMGAAVKETVRLCRLDQEAIAQHQ